MSETSSKLTTALAAAQARMSVTASPNPIGLSEGLVRQAEIPEIDFAAETSTAIDALETAVVDYQGREGTANQPLVDARQKVVLLEAELIEARKSLEVLESKGTWLDHFNSAVIAAERSFQSLLNHYQSVVIDDLILQRYGQAIPVARLGSEAKADLRMHVRMTNLKRFHVARRGDYDVITPDYLYARAEKAAATLDALRGHIESDQANAKK
jgi:hypothetical protein